VPLPVRNVAHLAKTQPIARYAENKSLNLGQ
jgi:hypothetical protein